MLIKIRRGKETLWITQEDFLDREDDFEDEIWVKVGVVSDLEIRTAFVRAWWAFSRTGELPQNKDAPAEFELFLRVQGYNETIVKQGVSWCKNCPNCWG